MRQQTFRDHEETLKDIETEVIALYRRQPELSDWNVDLVYQALMRFHKAEADHRPAPAVKLSALEQELYDRLKPVCDAWMSEKRDSKNIILKKLVPAEPPKTLADIMACLKTLRTSLKLWDRNSGRFGYLEYVDQFIPDDKA